MHTCTFSFTLFFERPVPLESSVSKAEEEERVFCERLSEEKVDVNEPS